jgi:hypothetical protein
MKKKVFSHVRFLNLHYTGKKAINKKLKEKALAKILVFNYSDLLLLLLFIHIASSCKLWQKVHTLKDGFAFSFLTPGQDGPVFGL